MAHSGDRIPSSSTSSCLRRAHHLLRAPYPLVGLVSSLAASSHCRPPPLMQPPPIPSRTPTPWRSWGKRGPLERIGVSVGTSPRERLQGRESGEPRQPGETEDVSTETSVQENRRRGIDPRGWTPSARWQRESSFPFINVRTERLDTSHPSHPLPNFSVERFPVFLGVGR